MNGDANGFALFGVNGGGERVLGIEQRPECLTAIGDFGGDGFDVGELAEVHAALGIGAQWNDLGTIEVLVFEGENDLLVCDGFAVFSEEFEDTLTVKGAEVAVVDGFGLVDAVERPGVAGGEVFLGPSGADNIHFGTESHGE